MKQRKRHIIVLFFLCGLAILVLGRTVTWRMWDYLKKLESEANGYRVQLATAEAEIKQNAEYVTKWEGISGFQEEPVEERQRKFSAYLQSLIEFADLSSPTRRPMGATEEDKEEFQELSYKLTFSADLEELVDFLEKLDSSDRLLRLDRLEITPKWKSTYGGGIYEMRIPSSKDLLVKVTVSTPAAQPPTAPVDTEATP